MTSHYEMIDKNQMSKEDKHKKASIVPRIFENKDFNRHRSSTMKYNKNDLAIDTKNLYNNEDEVKTQAVSHLWLGT